MNAEFVKRTLKFLLPFLILPIVYVIWDPFKVVGSYNEYYDSDTINYISVNKDYVSTQNYINRFKSQNYNSFIFGNSRSMAFEVGTWSRLIGKDVSDCYHFDAFAESVYGINRKVSFILQNGGVIENAILVIDHSVLNNTENSEGHLFMKHPELVNGGRLRFQYESFKAFLNFKFLFAFADLKLGGQLKPYMLKEFIFENREIEYDPINNEVRQPRFEECLDVDSFSCYSKYGIEFYGRTDSAMHEYLPVVSEKCFQLLSQVADNFKSSGTEYRIIVSPLYDQKKINRSDLKRIKEIFGEKQVFDFSGRNYFTSNILHYYETSHYRPIVADSILKLLYRK